MQCALGAEIGPTRYTRIPQHEAVDGPLDSLAHGARRQRRAETHAGHGHRGGARRTDEGNCLLHPVEP